MKRNIFKIFAVLVVLAMVVSPVVAQEPNHGTSDNKSEKYQAVQPDKIISSNEPARYIILFEKDSLIATLPISDSEDINSENSQKYLQGTESSKNKPDAGCKIHGWT